MTYSIDFRKKVLSIKDKEDLTIEETVKRFEVGVASIVHCSSRLEPCLTRNKPATKIDMVALAKDVEIYPDAYQYECAERFDVSQRGIGDALKRLKISYKKTLEHPKADSEKRLDFHVKTDAYTKENRPIVYIDEGGLRMTYRALKGMRRLVNVVPAHTIGMPKVESMLLLKLPPHCVIVMDNATFHKRIDIQKIIQEAGHMLEYLPAYSPDLNPIEHKWAQSKAILKQSHCSVDDLFKRPLF